MHQVVTDRYEIQTIIENKIDRCEKNCLEIRDRSLKRVRVEFRSIYWRENLNIVRFHIDKDRIRSKIVV